MFSWRAPVLLRMYYPQTSLCQTMPASILPTPPSRSEMIWEPAGEEQRSPQGVPLDALPLPDTIPADAPLPAEALEALGEEWLTPNA